jgi:hypothetical protein
MQGEHYFIVFINDYTRMTWASLLKEKSEYFNKFKAFKTHVENETSLKIKFLRSDNEGEFTSNSISFVKLVELKDSFQFQELLNKMELLKGKIEMTKK